MITRARWLRDRICPELVRLENPHDQIEVWETAITKSGVIWLWAPLPALFTFQMTSWLRRAGLPDSAAFVMAALGILLTAGIFTYLFRNRIRRLTWKQLSERGIRICAKCGYDLTGNTSGVCSECGASIEAPVRKPPLGMPWPLVRPIGVFLVVAGICIGIAAAAAVLLWHLRGGFEIVSDVYVVACTCISVLVGYVAARRSHLATLANRPMKPAEESRRVENHNPPPRSRQ